MGMTFKQMQDEVLDLSQDLQKQTDFTLTRVKAAINRGYRAFVRATDCIPDIFSFTTVANQATYTSSDVANWAYAYKVIGAKYVEDSSEFGRVLKPYPGGYYRLPREKSYGEPLYYYILGTDGTQTLKEIGTYPIIDASSETLEVQAYRYPTADLSADGDEPTIPDEYREALSFYALWKLFSAYGHQNPSWRGKALDNKAFYQELVDSYKFENADIDIGNVRVSNVFPDLEY